MTKNLVEHIIDEEYVEASNIFAGTLSSILEQKLYEMKRSIDLTEVVKKTRKKNEDGSPVYTGYNTKADWAKYRKQNPQMSFHGTPDNPKARAPAEKKEKTSTGTITSYGLKQRRKRGYLQAHPALKGLEFIEKVAKYKETGKLEESEKYVPGTNPIVDKAREAARRARGSSTETGGETPLQRAERIRSSKEAKQKGNQSRFSKLRSIVKGNVDQKKSDELDKAVQKHNERKNFRTAKTNFNAALSGKDLWGNKVSRIKSLGKALDIGSRTNDYQTIRGRSDSGSVGAKVINRGMKFASNVFSTPWQEESYQMQEVLGPGASAVDYIHDFEKSKDSRFKGDSKEKRRKRAIAAYMHNKNKLEEAAWKDISKEKKKHPFGKPQNILKRRRRKFARRIFNEE